MIRRITAALIGTAAAMTMAGGVAMAAPSAGHVGLAAVSTPLPADGPHHPGPPGPPPHHWAPPPPQHHFLLGHDRARPGWRYDPNWGWWKGVVSPKQCDD